MELFHISPACIAFSVRRSDCEVIDDLLSSCTQCVLPTMKRKLNGETAQPHNDDSVHPARKRRLGYTNEDARLAQLYSDLSDEVKATRLKAAAELVRSLRDADPSRIEQALTRLIKGLCSSRKASRSGFFVALSEVLALAKDVEASISSGPEFDPSSLINKVESLTQPESTSSNQVSFAYPLGDL